ncbi:MAG: helix-hairpin-helix domain-containing protein [Chitinophagales bacterium]|nr:helix-hairpin-helix domain-containing protein [Chitinophagales bacterium]
MDNITISEHFKLLAQLMEIHGENVFKIRSYSNAGRTIKSLDIEISKLTLTEMQEIQGIGKAISEKIHVLSTTGKLPLLEKYLELTPSGILDILKIKGLGPGKIARLWKELNIETVGELHYACLENRLTLLKGFGEKTQEQIRKAVEFYLENSDKLLFAQVEKLYEQTIFPSLQKSLGKKAQIIPTGAYRRKEIFLERLEILIVDEKIETVFEKLSVTYENCQLLSGKIYIKNDHFIAIEIKTVTKDELEYQLFITSGSREHIEFVINRHSSAIDTSWAEEQIYQNAHLQFYPAECRHEQTNFFDENFDFNQLVQYIDIKGVVHSHSIYSDGRNTIREMAIQAQSLGYKYLVLSDHSKSAFYANGLTEARIIQQHEEIDALQKELTDFRIFKSIESDILYDGSLDYEEDILKSFDLVIASVHSHLNMDAEKAMSRLIKAIENPYTNILGHLTGRLLLSRKGYPINHKKIIDACKANGVVIEINANPRRLDIDWEWLPYCTEQGVWISINPDAHTLKGIEDIKYGVITARRGGLTKANCINSLNADDFIQTIRMLKD